MKYPYELINHEEKLPIKVFLHNINQYPIHWHEEIELIFVLQGTIKIIEENKSFELKEGDLILINSNMLHSSEYIEQNTTLVMQIDVKYYEKFYPNFSNILFECKSFLSSEKNQKAFNIVRSLLAGIMFSVNKKNTDYELEVHELLFRLIRLFISNFIVDASQSLNVRPTDRLMRIVQYINEHYMESISLNDIAEAEYLSVHYLSKYIKDYLGLPFIKYLTSVRLKKSVHELIYTNKNISDVALSNGFPNSKSYYKAFNEAFGITPSAYRKQNQLIIDTDKTKISFNYFEFNPTQGLAKLNKYINTYENQVEIEAEERIAYKFDLNENSAQINHSWRKLMTFGRAAEGLRAEWQRQLTEVQKEIPFEYIRFHGIFCDDMMVYNENEDGTVSYNFTYVDELFDFFLRIGIKPFIELGFIPSQLASNKDQVFFWWKANLSFPKDIDRWVALVKAFTTHLIDRYGIDNVRSWYFEIWNEPNIMGIFWHESKECFYNFFIKTFKAIKEVDSYIKVGGPAIILQGESGNRWTIDFLKHLKEKQTNIDFYSFHIYPVLSEDDFESYFENSDCNNSAEFNKVVGSFRYADKNFTKNIIESFVKSLEVNKLDNIELFMTEWNSSTNSRDLVHDTCFMAAFMVQNLINISQNIDGAGFWTFTDIFEEFKAGNTTFHGGFGFITHNGIKKPGFYAYKLLNRLGNKVIEQGEGYIITKKDNSFKLLFYNYHHYDNLFTCYDTSHISFTDRYNVFESQHTKKVSIELRGLEKGRYYIKTYTLDRENGSAFDIWTNMGAPEPMSLEEINFIKEKTNPSYFVERKECDGLMNLKVDIKPHGVVLVEIGSCK